MASEDFPRPFGLHRHEDVTGASGTGLVAAGVQVLTTGEVASYLPEELRGRYWRQVLDRYFADAVARPDAATLREQLLRLANKWQSTAVDYHRRQGDEIGLAYDDCSDSLMAVLAEHGLVEREADDVPR